MTGDICPLRTGIPSSGGCAGAFPLREAVATDRLVPSPGPARYIHGNQPSMVERAESLSQAA